MQGLFNAAAMKNLKQSDTALDLRLGELGIRAIEQSRLARSDNPVTGGDERMSFDSVESTLLVCEGT